MAFYTRKIEHNDNDLLQNYEEQNYERGAFFGLVSQGKDITVPHSHIIQYKYGGEGIMLGCFEKNQLQDNQEQNKLILKNENLLGYIGIAIKKQESNQQKYGVIFSLSFQNHLQQQMAENVCFMLIKESEKIVNQEYQCTTLYMFNEIPTYDQNGSANNPQLQKQYSLKEKIMQQNGYENSKENKIACISSYPIIREVNKYQNQKIGIWKNDENNSNPEIFAHFKFVKGRPSYEIQKDFISKYNDYSKNFNFVTKNSCANAFIDPKFATTCTLTCEDGSEIGALLIREDRIFQKVIKKVAFLRKTGLFENPVFNNFVYGSVFSLFLTLGFMIYYLTRIHYLIELFVFLFAYLIFSSIYGQLIEYVQNQRFDYMHVSNIYYRGTPQFQPSMVYQFLHKVQYVAKLHGCLSYKLHIDCQEQIYEDVLKCKDFLNILNKRQMEILLKGCNVNQNPSNSFSFDYKDSL